MDENKTLEFELKRVALQPTYTIGRLSVDGRRLCDTIEDKVRDLNKDGDITDPGEGKVYAETAIPYGRYEIILTVSPKFKRKLPRLLDVPSFDGILIHRMNTAKDSAGCIGPGENTVKGMVTSSTVWEARIIEIIEIALRQGKRIFINII